MGMDVYGKNPTQKEGEYFRANLWYWRPLWNMTVFMDDGEIITDQVWQDCHLNDGAGLDARAAKKLAQTMRFAIEKGWVDTFIMHFNEKKAAIPMEECRVCATTGIRTDEKGVELGMPEKELDDVTAIAVGRTHGWCNACNGYGKKEPMSTWYQMDKQFVEEWTTFLEFCGGFEVW